MNNRAVYKKRLLGSHVLTKKTVSNVILKQYKESLIIERKLGSERIKWLADQNKASKIIRNTSLEEKWLKNLDFVKTH